MLNTRELALYSPGPLRGEARGELAIAASTVPQSHILPRLLAAFSQRYPHVVYRLNQQDSGEWYRPLLPAP